MTIDIFLALLALFVAVAALVYGLSLIAFRGAAVRGRLRGVAGDTETNPETTGREWQARFVEAAKPVAKLATPTSDLEISNVRAKFMHAGIRSESAPILYFALKAVLAIALPALLLLLTNVRAAQGYQPLLFLLLAGSFGYYLPNVVLTRLTLMRQRELFESFPDALDLVIVCVEAGISLDASIARAASEIGLRSTKLAEELTLVGL